MKKYLLIFALLFTGCQLPPPSVRIVRKGSYSAVLQQFEKEITKERILSDLKGRHLEPVSPHIWLFNEGKIVEKRVAWGNTESIAILCKILANKDEQWLYGDIILTYNNEDNGWVLKKVETTKNLMVRQLIE